MADDRRTGAFGAGEGPSSAGTGQGVDVALFLPALLGGGAERVMLNLARSFVDRGVRVDLVLSSRGEAYAGEVPDRVRVVELGARRAATSLWPLVRYLRRVRPTALLSTLEHTNVVALLAARLVPGVRVVLREANTATRDLAKGDARSRLLVRAMKATYRRADAVVAPSRGVARELRDHLGVPADRIRIIPNPTITAQVMAGAGKRPNHPWFDDGAPPVILGVGRLSEQKDFATLLRAFAEVRTRRSCRLVILGEGDLRSDLEALADSLGVREDVDLPGFVDDPFPYMAAADVFVLSSAWEGLPNVLIQAMALGAPVVATDCPSGPDEITDEGRLGRLVPVGDADAMADAILGTLHEEARAAPDAWYERYRPETVAERYLEVLSRGGGRSERGDP